MPFVIREEPDALDVTLRELRRSRVAGILWSLAALTGVLSSLLGYTTSYFGAFCIVALLSVPLVFAPVKEGLRISNNELSHYLIVYGRVWKNRRVAVDSRTFYVPDQPGFLSMQSSTPLVRLTDSKWALGGGYFTRQEAEELATRLNEYLRDASLTSVSSRTPGATMT